LSAIDIFNRKLLTEDNPFPYPAPSSKERPRFMIGGYEYVKWFKDLFANSMKQGYQPAYVIGVSGAGKTHLLRHLAYKFYEERSIRGLYAIYKAFRCEFEERDLWVELFSDVDVISRLREILPQDRIKTSSKEESLKARLVELCQGSPKADQLDDKTLHRAGTALCDLLVSQNAGICIAIDNVDEYFRYLSDKCDREYGAGTGKGKALEKLLGTIRSLTAGEPLGIVTLLCLTTDVYRDVKEAPADMTHLRRFLGPPTELKDLSRSQCVELVHEYMKTWAEKYGAILPISEPDCVVNASLGQLSIYPFTEEAIGWFYEVTRHNAGDIVCICSECVRDMQARNRVYLVKDEYVIHALELAQKQRPGIIIKPDIYKTRRTEILRNLNDMKIKSFESAIRGKYVFGVDEAKLISTVEDFARLMDINSTEVEPVKSYWNPGDRVLPDNTLRIWTYKDRKIAVKYLIGKTMPAGRGIYTEEAKLQDINAMVSLIEAGQATHGVVLRYWVGTTPRDRDATRMIDEFRDVLEFPSLDESVFKIIGVIDEGGEGRKELAEHVDKYDLKLTQILGALVKRSKPARGVEISKPKPGVWPRGG